MISQQQWLQSRKKLLRQVKSEVELRLGPQPLSLRQYAKNLDREFLGRWQACPIHSLDRAVKTAQLVLGADFHAYAQSQRAHVRILRKLPAAKNVILALECLSFTQNEIIQKFIDGKIGESELLKAVEWEKHWGFPWEHYRPLLELAKSKGYRVVGLMPQGLTGLKRRDRWMAQKIVELSGDNPSSLIYVVVGEWHLAQKHLPLEIKNRMGRGKQVVTILQDSESLYFKLAQKGREDTTECLYKPGNRFCVMVSPPWMKWQSYLMFLEHTYDRDLQDEYAVDYSDHVSAFVKMLQKDLQLEVDSSHLHVYGPASKALLKKLAKSMSQAEGKIIKLLLEHDRSFLLPRGGQIYLSRPTINHASTMSGQYVHAMMSRRQRPMWKFPQDLLALVWIEAVGFFFSKWINPKRKSEDLQHLKMQLAASQPTDQGKESLLLALELQMSILIFSKSQRVRRLAFQPKQKLSYLETARIMGSVIGEKFFQQVKQGNISLRDLKKLLAKGLDQENFAREFWTIIGMVYK